MPCRFGTSGSVRASTIAKSEKCAHVRPHLLAGDDPRVAVALGPARERREIGTRARLAEQLAPLLLVAHHRRQEPQPLFLGSVREQRGRGVVQPERIQPAEVERPQLGVDRARVASGEQSRPPYSTGHVGTTSPDAANTGYHASYSARVRTSRTAAAPPRRPASIHARGHVGLDPRPDFVGRSSALEARLALLAERGHAFAEVVGARRQLERERLVGELLRQRHARAFVQQPLRQPERDRRPGRERVDDARRRRRRARPPEPRDGSRPTPPPRPR